MKLFSKLTLFITLSKLVIIMLFIGLLPQLVHSVASRHTNNVLREQRKKVLKEIEQHGIDFYLQGEESYGSYTLLKEEYISLEPAITSLPEDHIETAMRVVENDTLTYRILTHVLTYDNKPYILEIGKSASLIGQYTRPLQKMALYVLMALIVITILVDLAYTKYLLRPLNVIIRTKLISSKFPFRDKLQPVRTSTADFRYLDDALISLMEKIHNDFEKEREFTSNASHELMTPIGILRNKMENLIADGRLDDEAIHRIEGMMKTLNRLKKIVSSLLLISRIENDQFVKKDTINPKILIEEVMEELQHRLEEKNLSVSLELSSAVQLKNLNRDLVFQLFYNLIHNAIRYNKDNGSITISESYNPGTGYVLKIADTGTGIAERDIAHIFDRFKKSKHGTEKSFGLGLSIVKSIAAYHQITVRVQSAEGKGSVFTVFWSAENI